MPGLRSLVARRRSSLTSPPYTVQRNTPSPSLSDTSDHAGTPHNSEGGDSPMTERAGGVGEVQGTQAQDGSDVQGADGSTQSVNGEDNKGDDGGSGADVGDPEQEKSVLDASKVEDPEGEPHTGSTSEMHESDQRESPTPCDSGDVYASGSSPGVQSEVKCDDATLCRVTELHAEHTTTNAEPTGQENDMCGEPSLSVDNVGGFHAVEPVVSVSLDNENENLETEEGETPGGKEPTDIGEEGLVPADEEVWRDGAVGSCDVNTGEANETRASDVRKTLACDSENWSGGDVNNEVNEECETDMLGVREEADESHVGSDGFHSVGATAIEENQSAYDAVTEGANQEVKNMESYYRVKESVCESGQYAVENLAGVFSGESRVESETSGMFKAEDIVGKAEEGDVLASGDGVCQYNLGSAGQTFECGGDVNAGLDDSGQGVLERPGDSHLYGTDRSVEGETNYQDEMSEMMSEYVKEENYDDIEMSEDVFGGDGVVHKLETDIMDTIQAEKVDPNKDASESNVENRQTDAPEVCPKVESPPSTQKAEGNSQSDSGNSVAKNVTGMPSQKNAKGKKCSDLSATEIESTLASRGVTIVRRVVDNKDSSGRGSDLPNAPKKETGTSILPVNKGVFSKTLQTPLRNPAASGSGISVSLQPSQPGQANSPGSKDLYKSINARGTHIQTGSKINPALLNRRGSFQLTRGVSIHYNPKSANTNMNVRGNTMYPGPRGATGVGSRGPRMYNPRVPGVQSLRGVQTNTRPRGGAPTQSRRGAPQGNLRGAVNPVGTRGMTRPQRYSAPRGPVPHGGAGPQPRMANVNTSSVRGVAPQRFRGGMNQHHQPRLPGLPPQVRPADGSLTPKPGETMPPRSTTAPPQAKYMKTSPGDTGLQSGGGLPSHSRPPDILHASQPGAAEVSPQSRAPQFSPQLLMSGIQPQSEYGAPSSRPKTLEQQTPQSVLAMSSSSVATSQTGFTSQPASASHPTLPSSSHHLSQMNMMDASRTSAMGLPPHSGAHRLPPHSSPGFMAQSTSLASSTQVLSSQMATSDRYSSSISSGAFSTIPTSEYLGRPGSEMFSTYSSPGEYSPHSTASAFPHMNTGGDFGMQSPAGGFPSQTNLVGFPPQGYSQHPSSSEFPSHNPAGVVRQTRSDRFASHPTCNSFPVGGNPGSYPPIPCSEPYNTPANPGTTFRENTELYSYPAHREYMMHPGSREFQQHYNTSPQMTNQLPLPAADHRDLPMSQSPRDLPLQNCNPGIPMQPAGGTSSLGNIIGDQYTSFAEPPLSHSTYQGMPVRTNSSNVPMTPDYRETDIRQNFRDSSTPQYSSYQEPNTQDNIRTPQMHSGYRDIQMDPNVNLEAQSAHPSFKEQQSTRYQEDGMLSRYLEQSVLNYPETDSLNACRDQPIPNFGSPASHASPSEQVLPSCTDNINHINYPDTMSSTGSRQHLMPGLGAPINYGSYRGSVEFNSACEPPNQNLQESLNYVSGQDTKPAVDGMYKDHVPVSSYNVNSNHLSMEGAQSDVKYKKDVTYSQNTALLPSFTESFDHSASEMSGKKDGSSSIPHFRGSPNVPLYQRNLPEYTNSTTPYDGHGAAAAAKGYSYSGMSDSKNSGLRDSPVYTSQRGYATPSYSPAQSCSPDQQYIGGSGNNFQAKSDFHITGDSLVPPDKGILESPVSQGSSTITSTNSTQSDPSGRRVPDCSVTNPETSISSSKVSTSAHGIRKNCSQSVATTELCKDAKKCEASSASGPGKGREVARVPGGDTSTKSPGSHSVDSAEKFPLGMSPSKSDTGSPSTQDRIVIKMKLLHSSSSAEEDVHNAENGKATEFGLASKSSAKYSVAKYTCWTIDSIINGREDLGSEEILDQNNDCDNEELEVKDKKKASVTEGLRKTRKRNAETCEDLKDTNLDTNKNLMKKSLKITIPLRNKMPPEDVGKDEKNVKGKQENVVTNSKSKTNNGKVRVLDSVCEEKYKSEQIPENQLQCSTRKGKVVSGKSESVDVSADKFNSSNKKSETDCEDKHNKDSSVASKSGLINNHSVKSDVKKCSIVIKRIYKNDNYSCYSSSLCDKKTVLSIKEGTQRRSKRRAAVEATERCQKALKSLDTGDVVKCGKVSFTRVLGKNKNVVSVNVATKKSHMNQITECSVLLYDVFMNHRINQMVCPGCSRHYDSSDSVQVNMNKATISLLCSSCRWLVVKDIQPQEVESLVRS